MKREFLKNFKVGEQELPKEVIDAIMEENGRDIETGKSKFADYDTLKTQLGEANETIEGFKALDVDGIKRAADNWKLKAEQAKLDADAKIADMEFDGRLTTAITGAKGRNADKLYMSYSKLVNSLVGIEAGQRDSVPFKTISTIMFLEDMILHTVDEEISKGTHYKQIYQTCKANGNQIMRFAYLPRLTA